MQNPSDSTKGLPNKAIIGGVVAVIIIVVFLLVVGQKQKFEPVLEGAKAPDFVLPDLSGKMVKLSDYRGKVVFLNFWATWCKPCEEEMPSMSVMYEVLKKQNFGSSGLSVDTCLRYVLEAFENNYKQKFPILHD